jgi:hypothetical protein
LVNLTRISQRQISEGVLRTEAQFLERFVRKEVVFAVQVVGLQFECLEKSLILAEAQKLWSCFKLVALEKIWGKFAAENYLVCEKSALALKIFCNDLLKELQVVHLRVV